MPSLSFQKRFADRVERGEKTHSIRSRRKRPAEWALGKTVHLFTAMRTRSCRRLGSGTIIDVVDITITESGIYLDEQFIRDRVWLDSFAVQDGFADWHDFLAFFSANYALPWSGSMIKWRLKPADAPQ